MGNCLHVTTPLTMSLILLACLKTLVELASDRTIWRRSRTGSLFSYKLRVLGFDVNHGGICLPALSSFAVLFFSVRFNEYVSLLAVYA